MSDTTFIYALNDPRTGETRYLGKSDFPKRRFQKHLRIAHKARNHRECWILSLLNLGLHPVLEVVDEIPTSQWQLWEREYIRVFRAIGFDLTNGTDGGEGTALLGEKNPMFGKPLAPEHREKIRAAKVGRPGTRLGIKHSPESREKMRLAHLGKKLSPETCEKMRKAKTGKPTIQRGKPWSVARRSAEDKRKYAQRANSV